MANLCNITRLGSGELYPEVQEVGTKIVILAFDGMVEFDCAKLQDANHKHFDVVLGADGKMAIGLENGSRYVANIDIPPCKFTYQQSGQDEDNVERVQVPFTAADITTVHVNLWPIDKIETSQGVE